jgi:hypothetical protein
MVSEIQAIEKTKESLVTLGYLLSDIRQELRTSYGKYVDLVVYEAEKLKFLVEVKSTINFSNETDFGFHPTVRQAQRLAQEMDAPNFAVSDGQTIWWFEVDQNSGRPVQMNGPIVPEIQTNESKQSLDAKKEYLRRGLWHLADIGRGNFGIREIIDSIGLIILSQAMSIKGDYRLENLLKSPNPVLHNFDRNLHDLIFVTEDNQSSNSQGKYQSEFYEFGFSLFQQFDIQNFQPAELIDLIDGLGNIDSSGNHLDNIRLPSWIIKLMVGLSDYQGGRILDIYGRYGDVVSRIGVESPQDKVCSINSSVSSYLWDLVKRTILGIDTLGNVRGNAIRDEDLFERELPAQYEKVIVIPPLVGRMRSEFGPSQLTESVYFEKAFDLLSHNGRLVAIVPEGFLFVEIREQKRLRGRILEEASIKAIISLAQFMPNSGIRGSIIVLDKTTAFNNSNKVLMARITNEELPSNLNRKISPMLIKKVDTLLYLFFSRDFKDNLGENGIWAINSIDLNEKSFTVDFYDPKNQLELGSQYQTKRLSEVVTIKRGAPIKLDKSGSLKVIGPVAVGVLFIDSFKLNRTTKNRLSNKIVLSEKNDVLIHGMGRTLGQAAVVEPDFENHYVSSNIIILKPDLNLVLPEYLAIVFNSDYVRKQLLKRAASLAGVYRLSNRSLKDLIIPLPDIGTQEGIIKSIFDEKGKLIQAEGEVFKAQLKLNDQKNDFQSVLDASLRGGGV